MIFSPIYGRLIGMPAMLVTVMLFAACAGPAPAVKEQTGDDGRRGPKSSGVAYREGPVRIAEIGPPWVNLAGSPRMGNAAAKIGIVEFSDFQCPYCRTFHLQSFPRLKERYIDSGVAQFIFIDFPLKIHPHALPAAMAANCAGRQGRYWEMHAALFANQERLGAGLYPKLARRLGLDEGKFASCLDDPARRREIQRSMTEARRLGLTGTPSFLIGWIEGETLTVVRQARGAPGFEAFAEEIEKLRQPEAGATPPTK